jgi:hypothetical protein
MTSSAARSPRRPATRSRTTHRRPLPGALARNDRGGEFRRGEATRARVVALMYKPGYVSPTPTPTPTLPTAQAATVTANGTATTGAAAGTAVPRAARPMPTAGKRCRPRSAVNRRRTAPSCRGTPGFPAGNALSPRVGPRSFPPARPPPAIASGHHPMLSTTPAAPSGISSVRAGGRRPDSSGGSPRTARTTSRRPARTNGTGTSRVHRQPTRCSRPSVAAGPTSAGRIHIADDAATTRRRRRSSRCRIAELMPNTARSPPASPFANCPSANIHAVRAVAARTSPPM